LKFAWENIIAVDKNMLHALIKQQVVTGHVVHWKLKELA
jgi:hypothetical protein